ncbi:DUF3226 domain-containing protein [Fusobacterium sp. CAG:649]|mgnify:FL=1|uniref:DUF3226 domain-containing protein n=1 Tax=Fusobacterium sp. CAG:649 TaxID=1262900 RepID=UPI000338682B|nr:DUF3226 domain-containing protein [Fusobacterium sp. CAG:649]CDA08940.1 uncharacterized protein BN748_00765 [Fusobacterium sp. CAG:649]
MTLNILFICEGNAEVFLLYKILKEEFKIEIEEKNLTNDGNLNMKEIKQFTFLGKVNNNNIYIGNISGVKNLNSVYVTELIESSQFYKLDKILFIMDADYGDNNESGFTRMEKSITDIIKKIQETKNIKTAYFISPNNRDDGMIENLLMEAMKCKEIKEYIKKEVVPKIRKMEDCEITKFSESKSIFMMIAATQSPMKGNASSFITDCYKKLDKDNEYFKGIKNFISKAIQNDS